MIAFTSNVIGFWGLITLALYTAYSVDQPHNMLMRRDSFLGQCLGAALVTLVGVYFTCYFPAIFQGKYDQAGDAPYRALTPVALAVGYTQAAVLFHGWLLSDEDHLSFPTVVYTTLLGGVAAFFTVWVSSL